MSRLILPACQYYCRSSTVHGLTFSIRSLPLISRSTFLINLSSSDSCVTGAQCQSFGGRALTNWLLGRRRRRRRCCCRPALRRPQKSIEIFPPLIVSPCLRRLAGLECIIRPVWWWTNSRRSVFDACTTPPPPLQRLPSTVSSQLFVQRVRSDAVGVLLKRRPRQQQPQSPVSDALSWRVQSSVRTFPAGTAERSYQSAFASWMTMTNLILRRSLKGVWAKARYCTLAWNWER